MVIGILYFGVLLFCSVYDIRTFRVLDRMNLFILMLAVFFQIFSRNSSLLDIFYSVMAGIFLLFLSAFTDCMGGGDVKFVFCNFVFLGFGSGIKALFLSCGLVVLCNLGKKRARIPMIPYLSFGFGLLFLLNSGKGHFG